MTKSGTLLLILGTVMTLGTLARPAHAELFMCNGDKGRFSAIDKEKMYELNWPDKAAVEILRTATDVVTLRLDDANTDGTHYLELEVKSSDGHTRSVKASRMDMVMYTDTFNGKMDIVLCVPVAGT